MAECYVDPPPLTHSKTPAVVAMYLGYAAGGVGIGLGFSKSNPVEALKPAVLLTVGVSGAVRHSPCGVESE